MSDPEKMERLAGFLAGRGIGVTPVEERIDPRVLLESGLAHMRDGQKNKGERLIRAAFGALLTEHSAYREALRLRVANDPMWREGLTDEQSAALTTPESPPEQEEGTADSCLPVGPNPPIVQPEGRLSELENELDLRRQG